MQDKFDIFFNLPKDLEYEIAQYHLPRSGILAYALTSKQHLTLFTPILSKLKASKFLSDVTRGDYNMVKKHLEKDIRLIVARGTVTDCSGRTFNNISGFEYTLWALDTHMTKVMLECVNQNRKGSIDIAELISQYNNVRENGVTYILNGKKIKEHHFDFDLINALQTYVDFIKSDEVNLSEAIQIWVNRVGGAQKLLPIHVVHEYCCNRLFNPLPDFNKPLSSSKQFFIFSSAKWGDWFDEDSKLGVEFAIYKATLICDGVGAAATAFQGNSLYKSAASDLTAIKALYEIRTMDFNNLKFQLLEQITRCENH